MLKLFDARWLAIVMLFTAAALPLRTHAQAPTIVFSEIAWAGSSISSADEWIEFSNVSAEPVDLSGWTVTGAGSSEAILVFPDASVVPAHSTFLISNYELTHANTALAVEPNYVTATLSLPNGGFHLHLYDDGGSLVDVAGGTGAPFAGRSGGSAGSYDGRYASMVRVDGLSDGSLNTSWTSAETSQGFLDGVMDYGTPGLSTFVSSVVEEEIVEQLPVEDPSEEITEIVDEDGVDPSISAEDGSLPGGSQGESLETSGPEVLLVPSVEEEPVSEPEATITQTPSEPLDEPLTDPIEETLPPITNPPVPLVPSDLPDSSNLPQTINNILINEFVSDPAGDGVEWIELYNGNSVSVTLTGWSIEDDSGKATDLSGVVMTAYGYAVIESPKGILNNDGDSVILKNDVDATVDSVTYGKNAYPIPKKGSSLARYGDTFETTNTPTPGAVNVKIVTVDVIQETEDLIDVSDVVTTTSTAEPTSAVVTQNEEIATAPATTVRFVALYPNTINSDALEEYIEVQNVGDEPVDLFGWTITDAASDAFTFTTTTLLQPGETRQLLRPETKITLNNTGDTLQLTAPDGEMIEQITYGTAKKGDVYTRANDLWIWVSLVQTTASTTSSASATKTSATTKRTSSSKSVYQTLAIAQAKQSDDGTLVTLTGVVTSAPGTFGTQLFYVQDETGGIQVYLHNGQFPELVVGDVIQIQGELSTSRGERRVKLASATGVVPARGTVSVTPVSTELFAVNESLVGSLVTVRGQIQSKSATKLILEHAGATLSIYLKSQPALDPNLFERGAMLQVTGVLSVSDGELRLRPRSEADVIIEEQATTATVAYTDSTSTGSSAGLILLYSTMAALGLLALWHYAPRRRLTPAAI